MDDKINSVGRKTGKLTKKEQFDFVLKLEKKVSTKHFALHFCPDELSTDSGITSKASVDNHSKENLFLGLVIPKRWAKQSVRRSLIKRLCRAQFVLFSFALPSGSYVVRLKREFDVSSLISASSRVLRMKIKEELHYLFSQARSK